MDIFRTNLKKAKKLGAAKSGTHHWWQQRFTAIILSILALWLLLFIKNIAEQNTDNFAAILKKPYNIIAMAIIIVTSFYHGSLGMRVIIEDYVACARARLGLIVAIQIFSIITVAMCLVALFYLLTF